jgi:hypothetical protein
MVMPLRSAMADRIFTSCRLCSIFWGHVRQQGKLERKRQFYAILETAEIMPVVAFFEVQTVLDLTGE